MGRKQKIALTFFIICIFILLIIVGGYMFVKTRYPLKYEDYIMKYAEEYHLDPYFVCSIIWTESKFDPEVVSSRGAVGLMQIMPDTGKWIAGKLGMEDFEEENLHDPETNIQMGCWYLKFLSDKFDGDTTKIAAAYNAGHNRVSEWMTDPEHSTDGETLDNIPFEETKNYVKRERQSYEIYKFLYKLA